MYKKKVATSKKHLYVIVAISCLFLIAIVAVVLEKTRVTNFYTIETPSKTTDNQQTDSETTRPPTGVVDYGKVKPEDNTTIPDKTIGGQQATNTNLKLGATITSTRNSSDNTLFLIKVAVTGTENGTCEAVMKKGQKVFVSKSIIHISAGQYSCKDLSVPLANIDESGTWTLDVTVTDEAGASYSTSKEVII